MLKYFYVVTFLMLAGFAQAAPLNLNVPVYILEGSGWPLEEVKMHLEKARRLFRNSCQIRFNFQIQTFAAPDMLDLSQDLFEPGLSQREELVRRINNPTRPMMIFLGKAKNIFNRDGQTHAYIPDTFKNISKRKLSGVVMISNYYQGQNRFNRPLPNITYSLEAHELMHILLKTDEHDLRNGNLMSVEHFKDVIWPEQCRDMKKKNPLIRQPQN